MIPSSNHSGFTLIEVLVSLVILAIAVLGFQQGQAGGVKMASRAEIRAQAYALAQKEMTETEIQLVNKGFAGFLEEEKGSFKEEEFKRFRWVREMEKIEIGCFMPEPEEGSQNAGIYQLIAKIFTEAVRKIKVTVIWEENKKPQTATLTQLYVRWKDVPDAP